MTDQPKGGTANDDGLRVARISPDLDTRRLFAHLMKDAQAGHVLGAVVITFNAPQEGKSGTYSLHLAGRAAANLVSAAGVISLCEFAIRRKIFGSNQLDSTP